MVFDDVIKVRSDDVELWENDTEGTYLIIRVVGKKVVMRLHKGEELRCMLSPIDEREGMLRGLSLDRPPIETAKVLMVWSNRLPHTIAYVEAKDIEISYAPKEDQIVKEYFPHLFTQQP